MSAPTEAEIRTLFDERQQRFPAGMNKLREATMEFFDLIDYDAGTAGDGGELGNYAWTDLRPSEADRLTQLAHDARERTWERALVIAREELVAACMAFAAEHPKVRTTTATALGHHPRFDWRGLIPRSLRSFAAPL